MDALEKGADALTNAGLQYEIQQLLAQRDTLSGRHGLCVGHWVSG